MGDSQPSLPERTEQECILITHMHATDVSSGIRRLPAGFFVEIEIDGKITQTSNIPVSSDKDTVEWDDKIVLPMDHLSRIHFRIYTSFELGPRLGKGELLRQFKITVGEILNRNERLQPITFVALKDDIFPSCSSVRIITERRLCDSNRDFANRRLPSVDNTTELDRLTDKGHRALERYSKQQKQEDLDIAVIHFERVRESCPVDHLGFSAALFNLANAKFIVCQVKNQYSELNMAIELYRHALSLRMIDHPDHHATTVGLGFALLCRFQRRRDETDRMEATGILRRIIEDLESESDIYRAASFGLQVAEAFLARETEDAEIWKTENLDDKIQSSKDLLQGCSLWDPRRTKLLEYLGVSMYLRFKQYGSIPDIQDAVSAFEQAILLIPESDPNVVDLLGNLGVTLLSRFERIGDLVDLSRSISALEKGICLTPDGHSDKPSLLNNLGNSLSSRFGRLGNLVDLTRSISIYEEAVHLTPDGHSDKPSRMNNLGNSLLSCFERLGDLVDLTRSISIFEEVVRLTPDGHSDKPSWLNNLGNSLIRRFERLGDLVDLSRSISTYGEAVRLTPDGHPKKLSPLNNLGNSLFHRFKHHGELIDLTRSISTFEEAVHMTPDGHADKPSLLNNLGSSLFHRFKYLGDLVDLTRSISIFEEVLHLTPDGHPDKTRWLSNLGNSLLNLFERLGDLVDLTRSISTYEEAVRSTTDGHPDKPGLLNNFGNSLLSRFEHFGDLVDLTRAITTYEEAVYLTLDGHPDKPGRLNNLGSSLLRRFERHGDLIDLTRSISTYEEAVRLTPDGHSDKPGRLNNLGNSLYRRFERHGDLIDLTRSISFSEVAVHLTPDGHPDKVTCLNNLGNSVVLRFEQSQVPDDLSTAISYFSLASLTAAGTVSIRFRISQRWISLALHGNSETLLDAYATAIALLPELAWLGLPLTERHRLLESATQLARDGAAAALEAGCPEKAVEWLEQGRSVVWTQLLQLRTPVDELRARHPALAQELEHISHQLERSNDRISGNRFVESGTGGYHDLADRRGKLLAEIRTLPDFEQFLLPKSAAQLAALAHSGPVVYLTAGEHRCDALILLAEAEGVISVPLFGMQCAFIESLRRLHSLLVRHRLVSSLSRDELSAVAYSKENEVSRCFFDLLLDGGDTAGIDRAVKHKPQRIQGYTPDELFQKILEFLWTTTVKPVLEALGLPKPPSSLQRIYWCATGPFSFLPIHAAGLYGTDEPGTKLSEFAISSYVPTLGVLASPIRKAKCDPLPHLRLAIVPQPRTDGLIGLDSVPQEIDQVRFLSVNSPSVTMEDSDGTVEDVMEKLKHTDWVHFACHGVQDPEKPLDSGLCLANERRLKLSDIIQLSRPQGGLAFLSACQTAQGDEKLVEESVHLAAGMLLAGYSGVIGTMWAIRDDDGPKVAKDVYEHLFRDPSKVPDHSEAAEALHYAIQNLRKSGPVPFTAWVPFIHVGR